MFEQITEMMDNVQKKQLETTSKLITITINFQHKGHNISVQNANNPDMLFKVVEEIKKEKVLTPVKKYE